MDYKRIYDDLIAYRQRNIIHSCYIEKHHIIPRSLGGTDDASNIVALSGREHYVAHLLLARFTKCREMIYALWMMQLKSSKNCDRPCIKSGRMYEWTREQFVKYLSEHSKITSKGQRNSQYGSRWITDGTSNIKISKKDNIPEGWLSGRTIKTQTKYFTCNHCDIVFTNKKKKKYCCKQCENSAKPDTVKQNFIALKNAYDSHKCLSRAFTDTGIAYNGNLFKRFFDLYNAVVA